MAPALLRRRALQRRHAFFLVTLSLLIVLASLLALGLGRYPASILESIAALTGHSPDITLTHIVYDVRVPRILMALLVGAGLSVAGCTFQGIFNNPLAAPDTLGVATGSAFGAVLGLLLGGNGAQTQGSALVFGVLAMIIVMSVSRTRKAGGLLMLILAGMIVSALFTALISLAKILADPQDQLPGIVYWMMGSLTGATWRSLTLGFAPILFGIAVLWSLRWRLNVMSLSETEAQSLGIRVTQLRWVFILASTLITASAVSMTGLIGWVGLIIPHAARLLVGGDFRRVLPISLLLGALFLLAADTLARASTNAEIPVAVITSVIGAPLFLWLLARKIGERV